MAHSAHGVNQDSVLGGCCTSSDKAKGTGIQGMQRSDGVQEPWVTLTAEGLWVLPGQLPFQRPVGEGKAHRLNPLSRQARLSAVQPPLLSALGRWGWWWWQEFPPHCCHTPFPGWREAQALSPSDLLSSGWAPATLLSVSMHPQSWVWALDGPSTCNAFLTSNPPLPGQPSRISRPSPPPTVALGYMSQPVPPT